MSNLNLSILLYSREIIFILQYFSENIIRGNPIVEENGDIFRDTMALTLRGDGVQMRPFFIKHLYGNASKASGRRPKSGEVIEKGMTKKQMKKNR